MNDGLLRVNFSALAEAGVDIQKAIDELDSQLGQLNADSAKLVAGWEGDAKESYAERQRKWTAASDDLKTILRGIQGAVVQSAQDYAQTESKAAQRFS
jgi:early secretory antigenic target protein ESAT-6